MPEIESQPQPESVQKFSFNQLRQIFQNISLKVFKGLLQSLNFVTGISGFQINTRTGDVEFGSGVFRGTITATSASIFNNKSYTVANLPVPASTEGFNIPSAYE